ncbi:MAG: adenylate/guanylate cyclase domain-containing protein [Verrucomicrobiae bacterium]|nr:adenylate/guanylate cyclase domain-containing protein [Verrucomicrobiae bacterium]
MKLRLPMGRFVRWSPLVLTGVWMILTIAVCTWQPLLMERLEYKSCDQRFHWRGELPPDDRIVLMSIGEESIMDEIDEKELREHPNFKWLRKFPYPRQAHAFAIDRLLKAGARVVALDLLFTAKGEDFADDAALREQLQKHSGQLVIGSNFDYVNVGINGIDFSNPNVMTPNESVMPRKTPNYRDVIGFVNYFPDFDGVIRCFQTGTEPKLRVETPNSFDVLVARKLFPEKFTGKPEVRTIVFAGREGTYKAIPYFKIFSDKHWERPPLNKGEIFKNKVVLIGPWGDYMHDRHLTPFDLMNGVEIHANAIATLLNNRNLRAMDRGESVVLLLVVSVILAFGLWKAKTPFAKLLFGAGMAVGYLLLAQLAFVRFDRFLLLVPTEIILLGSVVSVVSLQAIFERLEKQRARGFLCRYVSKNIAEQILGSEENVDTVFIPTRRFVTILMSDVRDFTTMTEGSEPGPFVQQLNEYLTAMTECVFDHDGTLDKFVGDAVMAVFGSPTSRGKEEDALRAVKTALAMRARLAALNEQWAKDGRRPFRFGIGINAGEVMAGDIGSSQKAEYGVIGDPVNVAARVESLTKEQKTDILIADSVYELVRNHVQVEPRGDMKVKGRAQPVRIYALQTLR